MTETTNFNPTLLPCPFCGNEDVYYAEWGSGCTIRCDECDFDLTEHWRMNCNTEGIELVSRWNRRAPDSPKDTLIAELIEALEEVIQCCSSILNTNIKKYDQLIAKAKGETTSSNS